MAFTRSVSSQQSALQGIQRLSSTGRLRRRERQAPRCPLKFRCFCPWEMAISTWRGYEKCGFYGMFSRLAMDKFGDLFMDFMWL